MTEFQRRIQVTLHKNKIRKWPKVYKTVKMTKFCPSSYKCSMIRLETSNSSQILIRWTWDKLSICQIIKSTTCPGHSILRIPLMLPRLSCMMDVIWIWLKVKMNPFKRRRKKVFNYKPHNKNLLHTVKLVLSKMSKICKFNWLKTHRIQMS
jgi:hypothetical protein